MMMKKTKEVKPVTLDDVAQSVEKARRKLGESAYTQIKALIDRAKDHSTSSWNIVRVEGKKPKYECSTCGVISPVPLKYCMHCGTNKADDAGKVRKVEVS